jgi:hypothetical protein
MPLEAAAIVPAVCVPCPPVPIVPRGRVRVGSAALARDALREVDVLDEVRVILIEPGIDVTDDDSSATTGDLVRLGRVYLPHIPLKSRERVGVGRRGIGQVARWRAFGVRHGAVGPDAEARSRRDTLDADVADQLASERRARRLCDNDADLAVLGDDGTAGLLDVRRRACRNGVLVVEHDVLGCARRSGQRERECGCEQKHERAPMRSSGQELPLSLDSRFPGPP